MKENAQIRQAHLNIYSKFTFRNKPTNETKRNSTN